MGVSKNHMTAMQRKKSFDAISNVIGLTKLEVMQHQKINDLSLNIHIENHIRDVLNCSRDCALVNLNLENQNSPNFDLIDKKNKIVIQITSTSSTKKIRDTLKGYRTGEFKDYTPLIFLIGDKTNHGKAFEKEILDTHNVKLKDLVFNYDDLLIEIDNLETNKLVLIENLYFSKFLEKYTEEQILDLAISHLVEGIRNLNIHYDDDISNMDVDKKIIVNGLNRRTSRELSTGMDYSTVLENLEDPTVISALRSLVLDNYYKEILIDNLKSKVEKSKLIGQTVEHLQIVAVSHKLDFNKLLDKLSKKISSFFNKIDFNGLSVPWIIVAYFFEICDIGVVPYADAKQNS